MSTEHKGDPTRIEVFLDDGSDPIVTHSPPVRFQLDTTELADGPHVLRIKAYDSTGRHGVREVPFSVRNGPAIAVNGLEEDDVLEGKLPILINAYGGREEAYWDPSRIETPAPVPTWIWVLFIVVVAFGVFYSVQQWRPPPELAKSPTYSNEILGGSAAEEAPAGEEGEAP